MKRPSEKIDLHQEITQIEGTNPVKNKQTHSLEPADSLNKPSWFDILQNEGEDSSPIMD